MEISRVKGNTYCIDAMETIPFYKRNEKEIILLDSGYKVHDREGLVALFEKEGLRVSGIIGSHTHIDHGGNHMFFKERDHAVIALPFAEAAIASSMLMLKSSYFTWSPKQIEKTFRSILAKPDIVIPDTASEVTVCGIRFGVLQLPGHSPGHIGISTPDNVLYVGDALMGHELIETAKLPTAFSHADDLESKKCLYDVKYDKYILAHEGVYDDITNLIDKNIEKMEERAAAVANLLTYPMGMDEITSSAWTAFGMRSNRLIRIAIFERNLRVFVEYLLDRGDVVFSVEAGVRKYVKADLAD